MFGYDKHLKIRFDEEELMDLSLKARVRAELFKCAFAGEFPTYTEFYERLHPGDRMGKFPYQHHFNKIADEELRNGYPDITFIVRGKEGYPHQIDGRSSIDPDTAQIKSLEEGVDEIIRLYCPQQTQNVYRDMRR
jgi:hypothetical protein